LETVDLETSNQLVLNSFHDLSFSERQRIINEVAIQTKHVLIPHMTCSKNVISFFRPEITPVDIERNTVQIVDCVISALQSQQGVSETPVNNAQNEALGGSDGASRSLLSRV
jgi:hypothetical protein